ncbi:MAG: ABC transporter substrate-binding protein [Bdellovibrionales bacterium]
MVAQKNEDKPKGLLNAPLSDDVKTLDPALAYDEISLTVVPLGYETLYQYNYFKRPITIEPLLANGLPEISKNKLEYTIKIKPGIYFHEEPTIGNRRELKSKDFIYAWKRLGLPSLSSPGTWIFDNKIVGFDNFRKSIMTLEDNKSALMKSVEGFEIIDDYTLKIKLLKPYPQLLHVLSMSFTAPIPGEIAEKYGHDYFINNMVGTGPFKLQQFIKGSKVTLVKNENYRDEYYPTPTANLADDKDVKSLVGKKLPLLDEIQFHIFKESQPQWLSFLSGKIDISGVPKDNFDQAIIGGQDLSDELKNKNIKLFKYTPPIQFWFEYNMKDPIVGKNKLLRMAISHALNFDQFNKTFLNGRGEATGSLLTSGIDGYGTYDENIVSFDIEKSKELLKQAGFPNGKGLPRITYDIRGSGTSSRQMAEFLKNSLDKIGVQLNIVANSFLGILKRPEMEICSFLWVVGRPTIQMRKIFCCSSVQITIHLVEFSLL